MRKVQLEILLCFVLITAILCSGCSAFEKSSDEADTAAVTSPSEPDTPSFPKEAIDAKEILLEHGYLVDVRVIENQWGKFTQVVGQNVTQNKRASIAMMYFHDPEKAVAYYESAKTQPEESLIQTYQAGYVLDMHDNVVFIASKAAAEIILP